jgi:hypothetical protein
MSAGIVVSPITAFNLPLLLARARYSAGALADSSTEKSMRSLPVLFTVIIIDLIGFGIVVPILPYYAKSLDTSPACSPPIRPSNSSSARSGAASRIAWAENR